MSKFITREELIENRNWNPELIELYLEKYNTVNIFDKKNKKTGTIDQFDIHDIWKLKLIIKGNRNVIKRCYF